MSYIEPNTDIYLLEGVPLDPDYENTAIFPVLINNEPLPFTNDNYIRASRSDIVNSRRFQKDFFLNTQYYNHFTFQRQSYQRVNKNTMRLHKNADSLFRVNYMVFRNTNFQDTAESVLNERWFYAFVKAINYINNDVCEIEYEIDVMQTWMFDYIPNMCYIEREHSITDNLWENLVEENLTLGEDYVDNFHSTFDMNQMYFVILINRKATSIDGVDPPQHSILVNGIITPVKIRVVLIDTENPTTTITSIDNILDNYLENEIISVYQTPAIFGVPGLSGGEIRDLNIWANLETLDGHQVRNKKLYTYPYNFLHVSNNCGQTADYKYENWGNAFQISPTQHYARFKVGGTTVPTANIMCYPNSYKRVDDNFDEGLLFTSLPVNAWSGDTFKNWWVQNKGSFITGNISAVVSSLGSTLYSAISPNPLSGVSALNSIVGLGGTIAQSVGRLRDIESTANQTHGNVQTETLKGALGRIRYDFYCLSIKREFAEIIDSYFDRFGYATKRTKYPNRVVRRQWCYTQTVGCTLKDALLPSDDEKKICSIYNKGVTFWNDPRNIGDYTLDNSPLGVT